MFCKQGWVLVLHAILFCLDLSPVYIGMNDDSKIKEPSFNTQSTHAKEAIAR
jgi:hypothetical protein